MEGFRLSGCFFNGCVAIGRGDQAPLRRSRNITGGVSCGEQNRGAVGRAELVLAHVACLQGKKKRGSLQRPSPCFRGAPRAAGPDPPVPPPRGVEEREGSFAAVPRAESGPGCVRRTCEAPQKAREKVL